MRRVLPVWIHLKYSLLFSKYFYKGNLRVNCLRIKIKQSHKIKPLLLSQVLECRMPERGGGTGGVQLAKVCAMEKKIFIKTLNFLFLSV